MFQLEEGVCSAIDVQWVEGKDADEYSAMPWTASRTQTYLKLRTVSCFKILGQGYISVRIFQNSLNSILKTCISLHANFSIKIEGSKSHIDFSYTVHAV